MPYSRPASAYTTIGKVQAAYFRMINESGGIRGRKITLLSYDDGYNPTKTVEQVRKLVEIAATGARRFTDPEHFPWTMGFTRPKAESTRASSWTTIRRQRLACYTKMKTISAD
jgi:hypothetical protein